jgi:hypothetical protein
MKRSTPIPPPMRCGAAALLLALLLVLPGLAAGEAQHQITHIDGSVLQGQLVAMSDSLLILHTDFADSLRIPRSQVKAIYLSGEGVPAAGAAPGTAPSATPGAAAAQPAPAGVGQLEIALVGDSPRSSTRYKRPSDRERMVRLNTLRFKVFVDGALVHEAYDDTIEKDYYDRGWIFLRNDHEFPAVLVELPAGTHRVLVVVGNELGEIAQGEKQSQLFSSELLVEEVIVRPNEKTRLAIAGDGSRFRYGKYEMKLLSSH